MAHVGDLESKFEGVKSCQCARLIIPTHGLKAF